MVGIDNRRTHSLVNACSCSSETFALWALLPWLKVPKFICQEHHENTSYSVADILNAFENGKLYYPTYYMLQGSGCNTLLTVRESSSVPDNITITLLYPGNGRKLSARVATQDLSVDDLLDKIGQFLRECGSSGRSD